MAKIIKKNRGSDLTMTKEQEAIEICKKKIIEPFYDFPNPASIKLKDTDVEAIETFLSMIEKRDKEIRELKQALARNIAKNFTSSMKESAKSEEDLEMLNKGWQIELEKKDKQIDLMVNCILAREIGKKTCQFNEICTKYEKGRDIHCKECIKQYFANKVNSKTQ